MMPIESGDFFDQVSAARSLFGTIRTINTYTSENSNSVFMKLDHKKRVLSIGLNCGESLLQTLVVENADETTLKLGLGQNVIDILAPWIYDFTLERIKQMLFKWVQKKGFDLESAKAKASKFIDVDSLQGVINIVNNDFTKLDRLNLESISTNTIMQESNFKMDPLNAMQLDKITTSNTLFLQFQETESDDFTIIPVQADLEFVNGFMPGLFLDKGQTQLVHQRVKRVNITMQECQYIQNTNQAKQNNEEEDEFDDDDEEEVPKTKVKVSKLTSLVCSMRGLI